MYKTCSTDGNKRSFGSALREVYLKHSAVMTPRITSQRTNISYIPACTRAEDRQTERDTIFFYIYITVRAFSNILLCLLTNPGTAHLLQQQGGLVFISIFLFFFFMCRNSSGLGGRQSQCTKSSERRQQRPFSCCAG